MQLTTPDLIPYNWYPYPLENETAPGVGREAELINNERKLATAHFTSLYSTRTDLREFCILALTWKEETKHLSFSSQIAMNPSYQQIIGMGTKVIPFILEDLQMEPNHWFWALKAITGIDPIPPSNYGNIQKMTKVWLDWGRKNGYIL